ncbi:MAG: choice-of-anchor L domain-containing protein [Saprospiraceae bacterium]
MGTTLRYSITLAFLSGIFLPTIFSQTKLGKHLSIELEGYRMRYQMPYAEGAQSLEVCGLKEGETYAVWAVQSGSAEPGIRLAGNSEFKRTFQFTAKTSCMDFVLQRDENFSDELWFSIGCRTCEEALKHGSNLAEMAGISVSGGQTAESLIQDVFIGGGCFDINNVTTVGPPAGIGSFANGASSILIDEGVIIECGNIANALGPNSIESAGNNIGGGSDPDLALLTGAQLFDAVGIEFDFRPTVNTINFNYVFASEEYCEYAPPVSSGFNDVFGFFISGPGISGGFLYNGANIATLPGSGIYVSINNVNPVSNTGYFVPNSLGSCGGGTAINDIQFDGFTSLLTAVANVVPCATYHIRLLVADAGDGIFDSAVFLQANSFNAGGTATGEANAITTGTNIVYESCNDGSFIFSRAGSNTSMPLFITYTISPTSTATPGVDYAPLPTSIVIPPGLTEFALPVTVFDDGITEGIETIVLSITNSCSCSSYNIILEIHDPPVVSAILPDEEVCAGTPVFLEPDVQGGIPGGQFSYQWSTGANTPSVLAVPLTTTTYTVTVTDQCGTTAEVTNTVGVSEVPTAFMTGTGFLCTSDPTQSVDLTIDFTGTAPWEFQMYLNGVPLPPITTSENPYVYTTNVPGTYELFSVTSVVGNCQGAAVGVSPVLINTVTVDAVPSPPTCAGTGAISANPDGGIPPYSFAWSNGFPDLPTAIGLSPGTYTVTVTDFYGCTGTDQALIVAGPSMEATATVPSGANCLNPNGGSINIAITGGTPPLTYNWTGGIGNTGTPTGLAPGNYTVTVSDNFGCTDIASAIVPADTISPAAVATPGQPITCNNGTSLVNGQGSSTGANISYQWSGAGVQAGQNTIEATVNQSGTYNLLVTNTTNGCTAEASATVTADQITPVAMAVGGTLNCTTTTISLDGSGSSTGANIGYDWTGPGILSGGNTLSPTVNQDGLYTLTVTNLTNGCSDQEQVNVDTDADVPNAVIAAPQPLTCSTTSLTLDGSGSSAGPNYGYQWYQGSAPITGQTSTTLGVSATGSYQLVVTDQSNGCSDSYSVQVSNDLTPPSVAANVASLLTCNQTTTGISANVNGNTAGYTFNWTTTNGTITAGDTNANATAGAPGTYNVVVTSLANGCTGTASVEVQQDANTPEALIDPSNNLNCVNTQSLLDATASSQSPTITFNWTTVGGSFLSGQNTLSPTVDAPGTYTLTILDSSNNCESQSTVTISEDIQTPQINLPPPVLLTCDVTSMNLGAQVPNVPAGDLDFEWLTGNGTFDGATNTLNPSISTPGTYTLSVTNEVNGCSASESITIDQNITAPTVQIAQPDLLTCSNNTVSLNAGGSSTGANFDIVWSTGNGSIISGTNSLNAMVDAAGIYQLVITNTANGCSQSAQTTVEENVQLPQVSAGPTATLTCSAMQLPLAGTASTGSEFTYQWTGPGIVNGASTLNPVVNQPGSYQLQVTNILTACTATSTVTIDQDIAAPTAEAGTGGELSCTTTAMTLDGNGSSTQNVQYSWTSPNGNIVSGENTLTPTINAPGNYIIEVTNLANGCTSTDEVEITEDDSLPEVDAGTASPITCLVNQVSLNGSGSVMGPEYSYQWSTNNGNIVSGDTTLTPTVNAPGIYVLTVTNALTNCTNLASVTVAAQTTPPVVEAGPTDQLNCNETSLPLDGAGSATGANFTYQWTTQDGNIVSGGNTLNPAIDEPGTYQLVVTNTTTGCTNTDAVTITQSLDAPSAVANTPGLLTCNVNSLNLNGNGSSTGSSYAYLWTTTDGNIVNGANTLTPSIDQTGNYQLLVTNLLNGCTETASVAVQQDITPPNATVGTAEQLTCTTQSVALDGTGSSSGANISYQWSTTNGNILNGGTTLSPTVNQTGTYVLTVTNNMNGCTNSANVVVGQDESIPQAVISPAPLLTCLVKELTINASASSGIGYQYFWTTNGGSIVSGQTTLSPVINAPGSYLLTVTNLANGCTKEAQIMVDQDIQAPVADAGQGFILDCFDPINFLDGSGSSGISSLSYNWETTDGKLESGETTAKPGISGPGTYLLTVTNPVNGCTDTDQVTITTDGPVANVYDYQPPCNGDKGAITFSGITGGVKPYLFSLDGGQTYSTETLYSDLAPGSYHVVVQDAKGCEDDKLVDIIEPDIFHIEVEPRAEMKLGESYQIETQVNYPQDQIQQVSWHPDINLSCADCLDPVATPTATMLYLVTVVTENGCKDSAPIMLVVNKSGGVYVPTAFSPNGDGNNDVFMVFSDKESVAKINAFLVFDRWGETVYEYYNFQANDPNFGWDGKYRGTLMRPAVFTWFVDVDYIDGRSEILKGDVVLMQ